MAPLVASRDVLITGASGFVGRHLARHLSLAGVRPRGTTRAAAASSPDTEWFHIDSGVDREGLRRALANVRTVYHLAARVHINRSSGSSDLEKFRSANVDATRVLIEECAHAGVSRVVVASTVKVMGRFDGVPFTETMEPVPTDSYGRTKLEAERLTREIADRFGIEHVVLRFPVIYGEGMKANMLRLFAAVENGMPLPFAGVGNARSVLYVENAVAALLTAGGSDAARSQTFFVSDGVDYSTEELIRLIAAAMNKVPRLFAMPPLATRFAAVVGDLVSHIAPVPFSSEAADRLLGSLTVNASKLRRLTGFQPPFSTEQGIRKTALWFTQRSV